MISKIKKEKLIHFWLIFLALFLIIYFAYFVRLRTANVDIPLDYDPWWFYRHAKDIVENFKKYGTIKIDNWDILSYFPPGRPNEYNGYSFFIAFWYIVLNPFLNISFEKFFIYFIAVFSALCAIPAFFLARKLAKSDLAGLLASIFITLSPAFILVSMAGYTDSDVVYVFYTYLTIFFTLLAFEKQEKLNIQSLSGLITSTINILPFILLSSLFFILFAWNWNSGYYVYTIIFLPFIVAFVFFTFVSEILKAKKVNRKIFFESLKVPVKLFYIWLLIGLFSEFFTYIIEKSFAPMTLPKPFSTLIWQIYLTLSGGLKHAMLVNISVAELQIINPIQQFNEIASRVGALPLIISLIGFPFLMIYKFAKNKRFEFVEIFLLTWFVISLYLISQGIRFGLLFATSLAIFASYTVINLFRIAIEYKNKIKNVEVKNFVNVLIIFFASAFVYYLIFVYIGNSAQLAARIHDTHEMEINENWRSALDFLKKNGDENTLVATWWDPGHIIAGYTGLKVHADGAHCSWEGCIPYNHDIRIQDMGRILTTSNETEAYEILKKYTYLTKEQCEKVKKTFYFFNESICNIKIKKIYFIASQDLIFKYYWPYYFASCLREYYPKNEKCYEKEFIEEFFYKQSQIKKPKGNAYNLLFLDSEKSKIEGNEIKTLVYYVDTLQGRFEISVINKNRTFISYLGNIYPIEKTVYFDFFGNRKIDLTKCERPMSIYGNMGNCFDGMLYIDRSYRFAFLMDKDVSESLFTKMYFFDGENLKLFKLVFNNPEVKIFEVNYD